MIFLKQVMEILGLGAGGPPIADPVTFQVYPQPLKRMSLVDQDHFTFIAASPDDPYVNTNQLLLSALFPPYIMFCTSMPCAFCCVCVLHTVYTVHFAVCSTHHTYIPSLHLLQ